MALYVWWPQLQALLGLLLCHQPLSMNFHCRSTLFKWGQTSWFLTAEICTQRSIPLSYFITFFFLFSFSIKMKIFQLQFPLDTHKLSSLHLTMHFQQSLRFMSCLWNLASWSIAQQICTLSFLNETGHYQAHSHISRKFQSFKCKISTGWRVNYHSLNPWQISNLQNILLDKPFSFYTSSSVWDVYSVFH